MYLENAQHGRRLMISYRAVNKMLSLPHVRSSIVNGSMHWSPIPHIYNRLAPLKDGGNTYLGNLPFPFPAPYCAKTAFCNFRPSSSEPFKTCSKRVSSTYRDIFHLDPGAGMPAPGLPAFVKNRKWSDPRIKGRLPHIYSSLASENHVNHILEVCVDSLPSGQCTTVP